MKRGSVRQGAASLESPRQRPKLAQSPQPESSSTSAKSETDWIHFFTPRHRRDTLNLNIGFHSALAYRHLQRSQLSRSVESILSFYIDRLFSADNKKSSRAIHPAENVYPRSKRPYTR